ncbi:hypothetical protein [Paenibacillus sp. O199]|uniref:hypothetical protein n=1 Tax=Paenibacillus sp. O199 TaxID=1643925 RepID=UPI0007BF9976|nr:hypothetical protein [Paenibacillus sp. O199]
MKELRSVFIKIPMLFMFVALTACSGETEPSSTTETSTQTNESVTAPTTENEETSETTRPQTESLDLMSGEGNSSQTATLHQGEGFSLYVFEKFSFDAAKGRLSLTSNPDYYVDIEPLPSDYDLEKLKTTGQEDLEKFGEVTDYSGELIEHPLGFAELYLQASGEKGINDYMVWKSEKGDAFLFRLHNPKGEEASDFAGPVLVSLSTVQGE